MSIRAVGVLRAHLEAGCSVGVVGPASRREVRPSHRPGRSSIDRRVFGCARATRWLWGPRHAKRARRVGDTAVLLAFAGSPAGAPPVHAPRGRRGAKGASGPSDRRDPSRGAVVRGPGSRVRPEDRATVERRSVSRDVSPTRERSAGPRGGHGCRGDTAGAPRRLLPGGVYFLAEATPREGPRDNDSLGGPSESFEASEVRPAAQGKEEHASPRPAGSPKRAPRREPRAPASSEMTRSAP